MRTSVALSPEKIDDMVSTLREAADLIGEALNLLEQVNQDMPNSGYWSAYVLNHLEGIVSDANPYNASIDKWIEALEDREKWIEEFGDDDDEEDDDEEDDDEEDDDEE